MHVHDDEQRAAAGRRAGRRDRRTRLSAGARLCPHPRAGHAGRDAARRPGAADRASPRRPPHAAVDARRHRGDAGAELSRRRGDRREPPCRRREGAIPGNAPGRSADPGGQGVVHRSRCRDRLDRRPGAWRDGLHRGDRRGAISTATRGSRRSTRAPTASRRTIWSAASSAATAARRRASCSPRCARSCPRSAAGRDGRRCIAASTAGLDALERATAHLVEADPGARGGRIVALSGAVRHGRRRLADGAPRAGRRAEPTGAGRRCRVCRGEASHGNGSTPSIICRAPRPICRRSRAARRWSISTPICFSGASGKSFEIARSDRC